MTEHTTMACPCGSGSGFDACCGALHAGASARTAEQLMRSRFSAFARRDAAYLLRTIAPFARAKARPGGFDAAFALTWTRLEILASSDGGPDDDQGVVHFRAHHCLAHHSRGTASGVLEEVSRFVRSAGEWVYLDARGVIGPGDPQSDPL